MAVKQPLAIRQGSTFLFVFRWETLPIVYRPITAIVAQAPARITAAGHGLPTGWRAAVVSARGMRQINAENDPPRDSDYHQVTAIDANTLEMNDLNAAEFSAYSGGGYVQYHTPVDLVGYTARLKVRNRIGGTELLSLTTENVGISIDTALKTIRLSITAAATASLTFTKGVYDLEMVSPTGIVTAIAYGAASVTKEVTTTP